MSARDEGSLNRLSEETGEAWDSFYASARHNDVLDPKTTILIHLAAAMSAGCHPCMRHYLGVAEEAGISEQEIGAAEAIAMAVRAGQVRAQFREPRRRGPSGPSDQEEHTQKA